MTDLRLWPMDRAEFDAWRGDVVRAFAEEQVAAGSWPADEAIELATKSNDALLPDGFDTEGMRFYTGRIADGTRVGVLWLGLTHPRGKPDCAFIYDIEIHEPYRGSGYGRALLAAVDAEVRAHGLSAVELNVFADNTRAVRLYETSGFAVVTQQMRKSVD